MFTVIRNEQEYIDDEIVNPFIEEAPTVAQTSIAKQYGTKYIGAYGMQLASSIVVDVRSYNKPAEIKRNDYDDDNNDGDGAENSSEDPESSRLSFFDEIMKSLEEAENYKFGDENKNKESKEEELLPPPVDEKPKVVKTPPKVKKATSSGKRKIDIDIISGDFGGSDII